MAEVTPLAVEDGDEISNRSLEMKFRVAKKCAEDEEVVVAVPELRCVVDAEDSPEVA